MRRAVLWLALLSLGVLAGFLVRLLFPRTGRVVVYEAPVADSVAAAVVSGVRRSA